MGLHRDGAKWHLPLEIVEQRRFVVACAMGLIRADVSSGNARLRMYSKPTATPGRE